MIGKKIGAIGFLTAMLVTAVAHAQKLADGASRLEAMVRDAETAAGMYANGRVLYSAEANRRAWNDYCRQSVALANQGEFRKAIREASKALFLGQNSNNTTALAFASRDLGYAYSLAGDLDKAEQWSQQALVHLSRSRIRPRSDILVPVHKVLGDTAARRGEFDVYF
jgi:tetratricopeptide (TPR) repeat protein